MVAPPGTAGVFPRPGPHPLAPSPAPSPPASPGEGEPGWEGLALPSSVLVRAHPCPSFPSLSFPTCGTIRRLLHRTCRHDADRPTGFPSLLPPLGLVGPAAPPRRLGRVVHLSHLVRDRRPALLLPVRRRDDLDDLRPQPGGGARSQLGAAGRAGGGVHASAVDLAHGPDQRPPPAPAPPQPAGAARVARLPGRHGGGGAAAGARSLRGRSF